MKTPGGGVRTIALSLSLAVGLVSARALAFPWMVKHDYQSCAVCHVDPSGAGQLTPYGRAQADVLLQWKLKKPTEEAQEPSPATRFLWFLDLPEVLNLSGNVRAGALLPIGSTVRPLFMAADLYGTVKVDRFVFHASTGLGLRNTGPAAILPQCGGETPCGAQWIAREFWAGATFADEAVMVRAGRMFIPFGLRNNEHFMWVRDSTGLTPTSISRSASRRATMVRSCAARRWRCWGTTSSGPTRTGTAATRPSRSTRWRRRCSSACPVSSPHPAVWVAEGHLVDGDGIAWTGDWVHLEGSMPWHCERSPMRQVLLTSTAPVPRIVVSSNDVALRGSSTAVSLPLWKVDAVVARCKTGPGELPSPPLEAELRCDGEAPVKQPLQVSLTVTCGRRETRDRVLDVLRLYGAELIVIGQATALTANLNWPWVRPAPVSATIVEVDPRGAVVGRRSAVLPARDEPEQVPFTLDLATPRNVTLAAELTFADGSTRLSEPQSLRIITRETNEREIQEFDEGMAELTELHQALTARRVCDDPAGAVRFLEGRPEVESASQSGKDISFITKRGMPSFVHCHVR